MPQPSTPTALPDPMQGFHPAVANWFGRTLGQPTAPQREGWPAIRAGRHTLIAAPTGSGKTLAAFLCAIDGLLRKGLAGTLADTTQVLYVSPLKALSNDIQRNLEAPLAGIQDALLEQGLPPVEIRTFVRTGDTPAAQRTAMTRRPPHIFVTTPESLYIMLTSESGRRMLGTVETVIVDEIHAVAGDKRGSHLALSLERLEALVGRPLARIGLSATQKPIEQVARFLVGARGAAGSGDSAAPDCTVVDVGHRRALDLAIELPNSPLEAVMPLEVWEEIYGRLTDLIREHRTTLVFVNTRRLAERVTRCLAERLGEDAVASHHGSLSKEQRHRAEQRLKAGQLRALVATASLELGIDIGSVDLVCQLGSTRAIATFLQRVGRSGHWVGGMPKGRLFPMTRDELVECVALFDAVRRGELDRLRLPERPLDILAQQIVAAVACEEWREADLLALVRRAWPYRGVTDAEFDAVLSMLADGFSTRRGRRGALLHRDAVNGRLRGRRGARLAAITSGGAIPDIADYEVVLEPQGTFIGTLNEDFAIESMAGDIFQLGNHSWRILRVESGKVRVEDAHGQPPTIPFWLGEAPGRSDELSAAVSRLREQIAERLPEPPALSARAEQPHAGPPAARQTGDPAGGVRGGVPFVVDPAEPDAAAKIALPSATPAEPAGPLLAMPRVAAEPAAGAGNGGDGAEIAAPADVAEASRALDATRAWVEREIGVSTDVAEQVVEYLAAGKAALGAMPTQSTLVLERFFDETGGMQLVVHAPFGSRLNRAWGLSLRKRFCRQFNFELQAAAGEDAIVLSLGQTHSFALEDVYRYLNAETVRDLLVQALLDAPMFTTRWRWNATRSLAVLRWRNGRKVPAPLQRFQAEDLVAVVFPDQLACFENLPGRRELPDHPLVNQTVADCLTEAMDIDGLEALLRRIEIGELTLLGRDLSEPSPLAQEILNARPYAFLDDAPLEERRTQAVTARRWRDPAAPDEMGALDEAAVARVRGEAWPQVTDADELHDALVVLAFLTEAEGRAGGLGAGHEAGESFGDGGRPLDWQPWFEELGAQRRAARLTLDPRRPALWIAAERLPQFRALYPDAVLDPPIAPPPRQAAQEWEAHEALVEVLRGRLEGLGPVTEAALAEPLAGAPGTRDTAVQAALGTLQAEGFAMRGRFSPGAGSEEWCERRLLARIHRYTLNRLRQEIEPVAAADFMRFLFSWQGLTQTPRPEGLEALAGTLEQLEGFEAPAAAWEAEILPARLEVYDHQWLDLLCLSGRALWCRLTPPGNPGPGRGWGPIGATPLAFVERARLGAWRQWAAGGPAPAEGLSSSARAVMDVLRRDGASFFSDLATETRQLPSQLEAALGELAAAGWVSSDGFQGLRTLITPSAKRPAASSSRRGARPGGLARVQAGRWSLLGPPAGNEAPAPLSDGGPETGPAAERPTPAEMEAATIEQAAWTLLRRYGVVARRLLERERAVPPWRDLLRCYRRLEARGEIRGGRFVAGLTGEQYALPDAVGALRAVRRGAEQPHAAEEWVLLSGADPLNLVGVVTPGQRLPAVKANRVLFRGGVPVALREGGRVRLLGDLDPQVRWEAAHRIERRSPPLRFPQPAEGNRG